MGRKPKKLTAKRYWTRVLSVSYNPPDFDEKFCIDDDLAGEEINYSDYAEASEEFSPPIFTPGAFFDLTRPMEVETYKLDVEELRKWGETAT